MKYPYCGEPSECNQYLTCMTTEEEAAAAISLQDAALPDAPSAEEFEAALSALQNCADAASIEDIEQCAKTSTATPPSGSTTSGSSMKERAVSFVVAALAGFGALVN